VLSLHLYAKEVTVEKAITVAKNFLAHNSTPGLKGASNFELTLVQLSPAQTFSSTLKKSAASAENLLYVFQIKDNPGFIIVSGDDEVTPVLGYSIENKLDVSNLPDNFRKWIEGYNNQIRYIRTNPGEVSTAVKDEWERLVTGKKGFETKSTTAVGPLLTTQWNQSPYYNDLCPYDAQYNENSVTGCVATAMAQIMKYWNHPNSGTGFHSYNHSNFGLLSASFGSTSYDWASMTNAVNGANNAVATLMLHCGISVEMNYSASSSGAYVVSDASPVEHCSEYAFKEYFGYDPSLKGVIRDNNYSTQQWIQLLKTELEAGRPIEYAGFGSGGGHAFVCDGFDANDFFHFNWGWGGAYDGYFAIDALDPSGVGTGGGSGGFNSGHQAVIGIKPPSDITDFDLVLYADLTISENPLFFLNPFDIHTDVANFGATAFNGDYGVAIFDEEENFVEFAEIIEGATLGVEMHYTDGLTFSNTGSLNMLPGAYIAGAFYRPTSGNWKVIGDGSYTNFLNFEVYYSSDIELYKDFIISTGTVITQNEPFTVTADILNDGDSKFTGDFSVELYDMEGDYAATVGEQGGADLEAGYFYPEVVFPSDGLSIEPGTYLMALLHKPDGGDWILSGSSYFSNPIKVIVMEAPLDPDMYEDNDSEENPYILPLSFSGNSAILNSQGSNSHVGTDLDFYGIEMEAGFNYTISARIHDSYNSGNQEIYTNDVLWSYYSKGEWSEVYDDLMPGNFEYQGEGEIIFGVAPYFEGETGSYLLDIQVTRTGAVSTGIPDENHLKIYPNPADDQIIIEGNSEISRIELFDAEGRMMMSTLQHSESTTLDISNLAEGIYFIHITQQDQTTVHKIVKQ
jgi:hypothetical protein